MEQKAGESNNDLLSSSGVTSNGGSSSPFFMSSIRGTIIENTSSAGTLTQIPFFPKYEVELDSPRKVIPYPGKEHIERVLEEYSHQVKDLQRRLNENRHVGFLSNPPLIPDSSGVFCPIFQSRAMNCMRNKSFT